MDIDLAQLHRGIRVAVVVDGADMCERLSDGVRVSDGHDEFVLRVQDGGRKPLVHPVAEIAEAMERAHNERRKQALRDLDAAHKKVRAQLRDERAHIAELEEQLSAERKRNRNLVARVEELCKSLERSEQLAEMFRASRDRFRDMAKEYQRAADSEACARHADELERALNMALTDAWSAAMRVLRDSGWPVRQKSDAGGDEVKHHG